MNHLIKTSCENLSVGIESLRRLRAVTSCVCVSGVRGVGGVQLHSRLGGDFVPEGDSERRLCLPGGAETSPPADLQPV